MEELLTTDELAKALKVQKTWIYAQTRKKGDDSLPRLKLGKYLRFPLKEVEAWLRNKSS